MCGVPRPVWLISRSRGSRASSPAVIGVRSRISTSASASREARRQGVLVGHMVVIDRHRVVAQPGEAVQVAHGVLVVIGDDDVHRERPSVISHK